MRQCGLLRRAQPILLANENAVLLDGLKPQARASGIREQFVLKKRGKLFSLLLFVGMLAMGTSIGSAADTAPKAVIHVITVAFKDDTSRYQKQAALNGAKKLPTHYSGITRV